MNGGSGSAETTLTRWKAKGDDFLATKLGVKSRNRKIMYHYMGMLWEQLRAMLPITLLQAGALALFTTYHPSDRWQAHLHRAPKFSKL